MEQGEIALVKMVPLEGVRVIMAADPEDVIRRFQHVNKLKYPRVEHMAEMREGVPIAIVAGGPSLNDTYPDLKRFKRIMVCGSAHNHLVSKLGIRPTWTVVCDPDSISARYITEPSPGTKFLIASACADEVFQVVSKWDFAVWNCGDELIDSKKWDDQGVVFGGGCTVLTRAIYLAGSFGFWNMHFFGCDTSIREDAHHAYDFLTPEEQLGDVVPIQITLDGPKYMVPKYLVGQLFDLKTLINANAHRIRVTVHGDGVFAEMMAEANRRRQNGESK